MSKQEHLEALKKLLQEVILPFHSIERDMPIEINGTKRNENDSEHSWTLSLIAVLMAPKIDPKLDSGKVAKLALVHDLVEIHAGDTSYWADDELHETKHEREMKSLETLRANFAATFPELIELIEEYENRETDEAKYVYTMDKFVNFLVFEGCAEMFYKKNGVTFEMHEQKLKEHRKKILHPNVMPLYESLMKTFFENKHWYANPND